MLDGLSCAGPLSLEQFGLLREEMSIVSNERLKVIDIHIIRGVDH